MHMLLTVEIDHNALDVLRSNPEQPGVVSNLFHYRSEIFSFHESLIHIGCGPKQRAQLSSVQASDGCIDRTAGDNSLP